MANAAAVRSTSQELTTEPRRHTSATSAVSIWYSYAQGSRSGAVSASTSCWCRPASACLMMDRPSAIAAIMPYSMPLCTILTKWPAPDGPQCRYPCSAVPVRVRPGVGSALPDPGAMVMKIGSRRRTGSSSPPIIRQ